MLLCVSASAVQLSVGAIVVFSHSICAYFILWFVRACCCVCSHHWDVGLETDLYTQAHYFHPLLTNYVP